jgi:hypothetical protein
VSPSTGYDNEGNYAERVALEFPELESAMRMIVNTPKSAVEASIANEHQKPTKPAKKK